MVEKRVQDVDKLIHAFIQVLQKHIRIDQVILFGSYSRKSPRDYSDIDIAVVSPDFEGGTENDCLLLDRIARKLSPLIEAIPYHPQDFQDFERGDFVDEILKTGRIIYQKAA